MSKRELDPKFSQYSDDEVISEAVGRLVDLFRKRGGEKYDFDVSFVVTPDWTGSYVVGLQRTQKFFRGQPPLKLVKPTL